MASTGGQAIFDFVGILPTCGQRWQGGSRLPGQGIPFGMAFALQISELVTKLIGKLLYKFIPS
ncbi:MAG: hypothetical protein JZU63_06445, partial [Rhodoferax sp.]|nr:hypothetical protein [Rhodoferax sp.]